MKLWEKNTNHIADDQERIVEEFTVGNDRDFDLVLAKYDILGNLAHAEMLVKVGLLAQQEWKKMEGALLRMLQQAEQGEFVIEPGVEDVHSQVELNLTKELGEVGKKIHSARSRNDQVLVDLKLYLKDEVKNIAALTTKLFDRLQGLSEEHKEKLIPGYTHLQVAMPSSFGLWFGAYAESLVDDLEVLLAAYHVIDKNPLGSAAGYGSSFPIDREFTTRKLGFKTLNYNVVNAQMSRGKTEKILAMALATLAGTLNKLAYDVCLYMSQNFGFLHFPDTLTTGSSIMPHKKNPDVFELIRGKTTGIQAIPNELILLTSNLPSGYHRDLQLTKESLFPGINALKECLWMTEYMLQYVEVKEGVLLDERYRYCYSVEAVNELVLKGVPFREAYQQIGRAIEKGDFTPQFEIQHTHLGSIGNLATAQIKTNFYQVLEQFE